MKTTGNTSPFLSSWEGLLEEKPGLCMEANEQITFVLLYSFSYFSPNQEAMFLLRISVLT